MTGTITTRTVVVTDPRKARIERAQKAFNAAMLAERKAHSAKVAQIGDDFVAAMREVRALDTAKGGGAP